MKLRLSPRAVRDLEDISDYINERNPAAARRIRNTLQTSLQIVALNPGAGRRLKRGIRRYTVPRIPYLIFYRLDEASDLVDVVTIRHAARRPEA